MRKATGKVAAKSVVRQGAKPGRSNAAKRAPRTKAERTHVPQEVVSAVVAASTSSGAAILQAGRVLLSKADGVSDKRIAAAVRKANKRVAVSPPMLSKYRQVAKFVGELRWSDEKAAAVIGGGQFKPLYRLASLHARGKLEVKLSTVTKKADAGTLATLLPKESGKGAAFRPTAECKAALQALKARFETDSWEDAVVAAAHALGVLDEVADELEDAINDAAAA